MNSLLIKNIGCLQTPVGSYSHKGGQQGDNRKLRNAAILIEDGIIRGIEGDGKLPEGSEVAEAVVDAHQNLVTPGLVEGHTIAWTDPSGAERRLTPVMVEDPETPGGD